ncbi:dihydrodipicolinate synthase family protein [Alienimonas chondri]|uniref:2-dehydro-3-deoxy-D-gluconate aldolase YagE n=1 Tax=Alienimonas chondri TaxID=2681879 RepID=A0ABX1V906_9PLAN|nr:dihydrodipicolinate synthase family protein [Alienimonas chondri]NNJ24382.1 putative 2-dehydro-3-deoxy-D-gluconate aldolase YagE [Alienimonas chondri]
MSLSRYHGLVPPLVTPLRPSEKGPDELDRDGLERLIAHVVAGGVHGLFALGSSGEGPSLSHRLQRDVVSAACESVAAGGRRVPLLIGVTDTSAEESIALARHAADCGADAVVLAPPYYFPAGQTELRQYVERLVQEIPLPVMLYNMPALTKVVFEIDTVEALSQLDPIVGVKDSGGDLDYFARLVELKKRLRPDWSVLIGPESKLAESLRLGGDGGVCGGANVFPKLFVALYIAAVAGDDAAVARLQQQVERLGAMYDIGKYASRHIKAIKSALSLRGICGDALAEPFNKFLPPERAKVAAVLETIDAEWTS